MIAAGGSDWQHQVPKTVSIGLMPCHCGMCVQGERDSHTYVVCIATQVACTVLRSYLLFILESLALKTGVGPRMGNRHVSCLPHSVDLEVGHVLYLVHTLMYVSLQVTIIPSTHHVRILRSPLGRTWGFHFPGGHGSCRLLLPSDFSVGSVLYYTTTLLCKHYWCTTGVIPPSLPTPSVLDQD